MVRRVDRDTSPVRPYLEFVARHVVTGLAEGPAAP
jgi:hypothetical protein